MAVAAVAFQTQPLLRPLPTFPTRVGLRNFPLIAFPPMSTLLLLKPLFSIALAADHGILAFVAISTGRRSLGEFFLGILESSGMQRFLARLSIPPLAPLHGALSWQDYVLAMQHTKPCACQLSVGSRPCGPRILSSLPSELIPPYLDCSLRKSRSLQSTIILVSSSSEHSTSQGTSCLVVRSCYHNRQSVCPA